MTKVDSTNTTDRASDISRKKKENFAGFSEANSQKNRPISREKSPNLWKNRPIPRDFRGRKVKIRRKTIWFRRILAEKSQISKDFQGQILRKIDRFPQGGTRDFRFRVFFGNENLA